jgi:tetratricopeptide (TPR) repeat protein
LKGIIKHLIIASVFILFLAGCSTEKNTFVSRSFHNTTAKYNVYFNGNESFKNGVKKLETTHIDNFTNILPLYTDGNNKTAKTSFPSMNTSIEKASKVIRKHSIKVKPKKKKSRSLSPRQQEFYEKNEYCNWVDDSYLLMGKSHFYKRDFYPAIQTFEYIIKEYDDENVKFESFCWLARVHIEMKKFEKSQKLIDQLEGEKKFPEKLEPFLAKVHADHLMKQGKYQEAIPLLEDVIELTRKKSERARYNYILGQLYQKYDNNEKSSEKYNEVLALNPPYEMAFNAKINSALLFNSETSDSKELVKALTKMLKDDKNIDYLDQIYYALANIYYEENDVDYAIEHYLLSAQNSTTNTSQKALSFLAIADIYFSDKDYSNAQIYYDSTITFLDQEYYEYDIIYRKTTNLTELVTYLNVIYTQDSLQRVAKMSESDRNKLIDQVIAKVVEEEERLKEEEKMNAMQNQMAAANQYGNTVGQSSGGKWYFYNPNTLSLGSSEFVRKWGRRKLEDNWRRKNKATVSFEDFAEETTATDSATGKKLSNKSKEYYMVNLPMTDSLMNVSHLKIARALYNVGRVYKEKLEDYQKAINSFIDLNNKYPKNEHELESYYKLYQLNKLLSNESVANQYKNLIVANYPKSKYALSLTNPNYFIELEKKQNLVKELYERTYAYFNERRFEYVIENYYFADTAYVESDLLPRFHFLKAMAIGATTDTATLKTELKEVIKKYPFDDMASSAKDVLAILDKERVTEEGEEGKVEDAFKEDLFAEMDSAINYQTDFDTKHYYVVVVESEKTSANSIMFKISNFNIDYFSMLDFKVSPVVLTADFQLITVKDFKNKQQALNYYESIVNVNEVFENVEESTYRHFVISIENFKTFFSNKRVGSYMKFFKENYIEQL